jgi:superfamily II helicase
MKRSNSYFHKSPCFIRAVNMQGECLKNKKSKNIVNLKIQRKMILNVFDKFKSKFKNKFWPIKIVYYLNRNSTMSKDLLQQISKSIMEENTEELVKLLKLDFNINTQYNYPIGCVRKNSFLLKNVCHSFFIFSRS